MDRPRGEGAQDGTRSDSGSESPAGADADPTADLTTDDAGYDGGYDDAAVDHDPLRFHRWMRSSASGGILTGIALGLQHALEQKREVPAIVMEAPGEPEDPDAPIRLYFDPDDPTKTVAVVRRPADPPGEGSP